MSWSLTEVPFPFPEDKGMSARKPGDCWRIPLDYPMSGGETYGEAFAAWISPDFRATGRDYIIWIMCPGGAPWCPDQVASNMGGLDDHGWTVTGEFPTITAMPSVGTSNYHGWLRDGVLSDDLEGRVYPKLGDEEEREAA